MRRSSIRIRGWPAAVLLALALAGCGRTAAVAPEPPLIVDFIPVQEQFRADQDIVTILHNRSAVAVYVFRGCPAPRLERRVNGEWNVEQPRMVVVCLDAVIPVPIAVPAGELLPITLPRSFLAEDLAAGTYRFVMALSRDQQSFVPLESEPFEIVAR